MERNFFRKSKKLKYAVAGIAIIILAGLVLSAVFTSYITVNFEATPDVPVLQYSEIGPSGPWVANKLVK